MTIPICTMFWAPFFDDGQKLCMGVHQLFGEAIELLELVLQEVGFFGQFGGVLCFEAHEAAKPFYGLLEIFGFLQELADEVGAGLGKAIVLPCGGLFEGSVFLEVIVGKVEDGDIEQVRNFDEVADFRLGSAVLVGGDIAPVEAHLVGKLFLAPSHPLAQ